MNSLIELQRQRKAKIEDADKIRAAAKALGQELTDEQKEKISGLLAEVDVLDEKIVALKEEEKLNARLDGAVSSLEVSADLDSPDSHPRIESRPNWLDDPNFGFKSVQDFHMAVIEAAKTRGQKFPSNLKHCSVEGAKQAVKEAEYDSDLTPKAAAGSDEHGKYADPYGGFFVPESFVPGVMKTAAEPDLLAGRVTRIPMAAPVVKIPARTDKDHSSSVSGGLIVYRRAEADTVTATRMKTELVKLEAEPLMGLAYATDELVRDSAISFAALLAQGFQDQFVYRIMKERIAGTGVAQLEGALNAPCIVEVSAENGQTTDDPFVYENALNMLARLWNMNTGVWLMSRMLLPNLPKLNVTVGQGGAAVFHTDATQAIPYRLLGLPVIFTEHCKAANTTGDVLLCNWGEYLEGVYQPITGLSSIHVRFVYNETTFKYYMENAGQWWWRTVMTPANSADSLSPVISLATRS